MKRNNYIFVITIYISIILPLSCISQQNKNIIVQEGKVQFHFILNYVDTLNDVKDYNYSIWYQDSAVIIQFVSAMYEMDQTKLNRPAAFLKTYAYVYQDLKNQTCQDYLSFDSSSMPLDNYQ